MNVCSRCNKQTIFFRTNHIGRISIKVKRKAKIILLINFVLKIRLGSHMVFVWIVCTDV